MNTKTTNPPKAKRAKITPADEGFAASRLETAFHDKTAHTPAPWKVQSAAGHLSVTCPTQQVAKMIEFPLSSETDANARLIAAAPDLLEAAKAWEYARKEGGISMVDWFNVAWEKTQAAIAKAEGNS